MSNPLSFSSVVVSNLAEGIPTVSGAIVFFSLRLSTSVLLFNRGHRVKISLADEGTQIGIQPEGRDNTDIQDASLTMDEIKTVPYMCNS